ncbi:MAG: S46 family peptidase [Saprospiraceae bacterium]|nr:S46 family peptidase [Saprospiraceae bacterium]
MWLPHLLKQLEGDMQAMGMKMSAEDIYSVNSGSLKDAILHFGGGCTGSIISSSGLVLTNHHCGYGYIQSHSSIENNYLRDGFWAKTKDQELTNPGLFVTIIRRIEDVTEYALVGVHSGLSEGKRQSLIDQNLNAYKARIKVKSDEAVLFRPIYYGNQYIMIVTLTYTDIRLVGTPPESIGKFGSDTDNWMWPRHTGDFSLFRIYAGPDNRPAAYSTDNKPYQPVHYLPVSLDGVEEGDFTLVFGFPGSTQEYIPASGISMNKDAINPPRIAIRDTALQILNKGMRAAEKVRLQYASKYARVANYWKKWIGQNQGLERTNAVWKKILEQKEFRDNVHGDPQYEDILPRLDSLYGVLTPYMKASQYYGEVVQRNIEIFALARYMSTLIHRYLENGDEGFMAYRDRLIPAVNGFFKDYQVDLDRQVFAALMRMYAVEGDPELTSVELIQQFSSGQAAYRTDALFAQTLLTDQDGLIRLLEGSPEAAVHAFAQDSLVIWYDALSRTYGEKVAGPLSKIQDEIDAGMRLYMAALMDVTKGKKFYPDANSTLRVTYGKVEGYPMNDTTRYDYITWLDGVMEKYVPGDYEFDVPERLRQLYASKDYGPYGENGKMPVCFIGSNHTTGGNSGSPTIDAEGNLIGLNFDRVWEGTMSDLYFDPTICRNIMVDARYILFIIDKYAEASTIVNEMTLVHPKRN